MKITIVGGGSVFTPLLLDGLPRFANTLPVDEVCLLDIDLQSARRIAAFTRRTMEAADIRPPSLTPTTDHQRAIEGSDFVIITIRVGGLRARIQDEKIPLRHGILGDETTGPGGFSNALRTIPVVVDYAREIQRWAPHAWVVPFTNPEGLLTEAITRQTGVRAIGLCTAPYGLRLGVSAHFGVEPSRVQVNMIGVTHTGWVRGIRVYGNEVLPDLVGYILERAPEHALYPSELMRALEAYPAHWFYSLLGREMPHFYYHAQRILQTQQAQALTRAETLMARQGEIQQRLEDPGFTVAELRDLRGHMVLDEPILALLTALHNDSGEVHVVDVQQGGVLPAFEPEAVLELPARIDAKGAHPLPTAPLPPEVRGLMQMIKAHDELTIEAAVTGSYGTALRALVAHPLVMSYEVAKGLLDDILAANRPYLPPIWGHTATAE